MSFTIIFTGLTLLILFYYFVILPKAIKKEISRGAPPRLDLYKKDLENLRGCIMRAESKKQITMCCEAVYSFRMRYRALARVNGKIDKDLDSLIQMLDEQLYKINGKPKKTPKIKFFY